MDALLVRDKLILRNVQMRSLDKRGCYGGKPELHFAAYTSGECHEMRFCCLSQIKTVLERDSTKLKSSKSSKASEGGFLKRSS